MHTEISLEHICAEIGVQHDPTQTIDGTNLRVATKCGPRPRRSMIPDITNKQIGIIKKDCSIFYYDSILIRHPKIQIQSKDGVACRDKIDHALGKLWDTLRIRKTLFNQF